MYRDRPTVLDVPRAFGLVISRDGPCGMATSACLHVAWIRGISFRSFGAPRMAHATGRGGIGSVELAGYDHGGGDPMLALGAEHRPMGAGCT